MKMSDILFRRAVLADLPDIVRMLADDSLGATRESFELPLPESYYTAFEAIERDANNELVSNKSRADAVRFYQSLGFVASHEGLKLSL